MAKACDPGATSPLAESYVPTVSRADGVSPSLDTPSRFAVDERASRSTTHVFVTARRMADGANEVISFRAIASPAHPDTVVSGAIIAG